MKRNRTCTLVFQFCRLHMDNMNNADFLLYCMWTILNSRRWVHIYKDTPHATENIYTELDAVVFSDLDVSWLSHSLLWQILDIKTWFRLVQLQWRSMHLVLQFEKTFSICISQTRINISECRYIPGKQWKYWVQSSEEILSPLILLVSE